MAQATFEVETRFDVPPERVFGAMTDPGTFANWMEGVVRVERLTDGPTAVGTRFRETRRMYGREASEEFEITSLEPNRRLSMYVDGSKGASKKGEYFFDYYFVPDGEGTRVRMMGKVTIPGGIVAALGLLLFKGMFKKACAKDLNSMKRWLESEG